VNHGRFIPSRGLGSTQVFPQSAAILASAWYPSATSKAPASYCFAASVRDCPVKLIDASSGRVTLTYLSSFLTSLAELSSMSIVFLLQLRASYRIVDHRERFIAPYSITFDPSMSKYVPLVWAGSSVSYSTPSL
jgi:hypothetical protein